MDPIVFDRIPFRIHADDLKKKLHFGEDRTLARDFGDLVQEAEAIGRPKALYKVAFVESKGDDYVTVEGTTFRSRVLRVNLDQVYRIFPYTVTSGLELEAWAMGMTDLLKRYWAEVIEESILRSATEFLREHLLESYQLGQVSRMSPGSLADWPIEEQGPLFSLLGNTKDLIGVTLNNSLMMVPRKSVSGIWFPTEDSFFSCQLCPRDLCPGRKAPYDKDLYDRKYRLRKPVAPQE